MRLALFIAVGVFLGLFAWSRYESWVAARAMSEWFQQLQRGLLKYPDHRPVITAVNPRSSVPVGPRVVWVPLRSDQSCVNGYVLLRTMSQGVTSIVDYRENNARVHCSGNSRPLEVH